MKYVDRFLEYFKGFPIFTSGDVRLFLDRSGAGKGYYKVFMHNLVGSWRAFQIKRGYYTLHDDPMAAGFAFAPFYYGMETALTHYDLWDYVTPISIITARSVRSGTRSVFGRNVTVRRIPKEMLFGYSLVKYEDLFYIPMADMEKTLIDSVYFRSPFGGEVYGRMLDRVDMGKLRKYLDRCPGKVRAGVDALIGRYGSASLSVKAKTAKVMENAH